MANIVAGGLIGSKVTTQFIQPFIGSGLCPVITSSAATNVIYNGATLNGTLVSVGVDDPTVTLYWGTIDRGKSPFGWNGGNNAFGTQSAGALAYTVSGQDLDTTFYYRFRAVNSACTAWTDAQSYHTLAATTTTTTTLAPLSAKSLCETNHSDSNHDGTYESTNAIGYFNSRRKWVHSGGGYVIYWPTGLAYWGLSTSGSFPESSPAVYGQNGTYPWSNGGNWIDSGQSTEDACSTTSTTTTTTTTVAPGFIITIHEPLATILARTGDAVGVIAFGTDTLDLYVYDGTNWQIYENS
jgi:hypothetical protein